MDLNVMADHAVPYFQNDAGAPQISIGVAKFMCCGANEPFDHPHVYLDMGSDGEIACPYCSTLYKFSNELNADQCEPAGSFFDNGKG